MQDLIWLEVSLVLFGIAVGVMCTIHFTRWFRDKYSSDDDCKITLARFEEIADLSKDMKFYTIEYPRNDGQPDTSMHVMD